MKIILPCEKCRCICICKYSDDYEMIKEEFTNLSFEKPINSDKENHLAGKFQLSEIPFISSISLECPYIIKW